MKRHPKGGVPFFIGYGYGEQTARKNKDMHGGRGYHARKRVYGGKRIADHPYAEPGG